MSDIVSAEAAAQEGEALLPSAELAKNLGLTLAASVVLIFSTIVYMQGGLHSYFYAQSAYALAVGLVVRLDGEWVLCVVPATDTSRAGLVSSPRASLPSRSSPRWRPGRRPRRATTREGAPWRRGAPHSWPQGTLGVGV